MDGDKFLKTPMHPFRGFNTTMDPEANAQSLNFLIEGPKITSPYIGVATLPSFRFVVP
jgi:hypothetical protein